MSTVLDSRLVFSGRILRLVVERVELPHGARAQMEIVRHAGASAMVPLLDDGRVVLVRQYRHAVGKWLLEVPAGTLSAGETPEACAHREVIEEGGYRARRLEPLGAVFMAPGYSDELIHLWLATGLEPAAQNLDEDENLAVELHPFAEAVRMAHEGEIEDAKSVCALLRAASAAGAEGRDLSAIRGSGR